RRGEVLQVGLHQVVGAARAGIAGVQHLLGDQAVGGAFEVGHGIHAVGLLAEGVPGTFHAGSGSAWALARAALEAEGPRPAAWWTTKRGARSQPLSPGSPRSTSSTRKPRSKPPSGSSRRRPPGRLPRRARVSRVW